MNEHIKAKCDLLAENREVFHKAFRWDSDYMALACAALLTDLGIHADTEGLKECWRILKKKKNAFSSFRGYNKLPLITKMYLSDDPQAYISDVADLLEGHLAMLLDENMERETPDGWVWKEDIKCTVISLFEEGCIEKGLSYREGGPIYNIVSPHIGGLADTVNSLYAIKKLVFDEKKVSFGELMQILKNNWEGSEALRRYVLNRYVYYGNDSDEVDEIYARLLSDFADLCKGIDGRSGYSFPGGVSTFGRQLEWSPHRLACPYGRKSGEVLAANASPTPGSDKEGATAIIRSYCKNPLEKLSVGAALDLKLLPSYVKGEEGIDALVSLMRGFVALGGFFMQPDVADAEILKKAQENPEEYQNLSVRVSGWNARFVTLNKEWQDMVIEQNER